MPLHACVIYALVIAPYSLIVPSISLISTLGKNNLTGSTTPNDPKMGQGAEGDDVINNLQGHNTNRNLSRKTFLKFKRENMIVLLKHSIGLIIVTYVLQRYTLSHPFLLADNRCVFQSNALKVMIH